MLKIVLAGSVALSALACFSSDAFAAKAAPAGQEKVCKAVFAKNKTMIERLAAAGNESGIRAILAKAGCSGVVTSLEKPPPNAKVKVHCDFEFPPPKVRCTVTF